MGRLRWGFVLGLSACAADAGGSLPDANSRDVRGAIDTPGASQDGENVPDTVLVDEAIVRADVERDTRSPADVREPIIDAGEPPRDVAEPVDTPLPEDVVPPADVITPTDTIEPRDVAPIDPREAYTRACPTGASTRITLWTAYANALRPDNQPWDGTSSDTRALACRVTATAARAAVQSYINANAGPLLGERVSDWLGGLFERGVASACGAASNWLQNRFEGPDMFADGSYSGGARLWRTVDRQDTWNADLYPTEAGGRSTWVVPCETSSRVIGSARVYDEDLAFDDDVETLNVYFDHLPPSVLCGGWAWVPGDAGLVGILYRVEVFGGTQDCRGLMPDEFSDSVLRRTPTILQPGSGPADPR